MAKNFSKPKDPRDVARYSYDFEPVMGEEETILGTPTVTLPDGSDLVVQGQPAVVGKAVFVTLQGGADGMAYSIEFEIQTSEGQTFNRKAVLKVKDL
jgi:hypothetical protein